MESFPKTKDTVITLAGKYKYFIATAALLQSLLVASAATT